MSETRYFIFNHGEAFNGCRLENITVAGDTVRLSPGAVSGKLTTPLLDSGSQGNAWRRVQADVMLPDGASITWRVTASDTENVSGVTYTVENADDFLLQNVNGQFLTVEAEIYGGAVIRSILIYAAWESFHDYLPEIYREYGGFADRFLGLFASQYIDIEQRIGDLPVTADPATAPPETLRRLAELAGVPHAGLWDTVGLRKLLVSGVYARHGQFSVFAEYLEYFTGCRPFIAENFRYITGVLENDRLFVNGDVTVFLPPGAAAAVMNTEALNVIIADFLPPDVICRVVALDEYPAVSGYAFVGINTRIGEYTDTVVGRSQVGYSAIGGVI